MVLVLAKDKARKIDLVDLACAPNGIYDLQNIFTIDEDVKITDGRFTVRHQQVVVKGRFNKPNLARGTIKPKRSFTAGLRRTCSWSDGLPRREGSGRSRCRRVAGPRAA